MIIGVSLAFGQASALEVQVKGLSTDAGTVVCTLYDGPAHWLQSSGYVATARATPSGGAATCRFEGVPAGTYGVAFLHDLNDNGDMDSSWLGLPQEPWGISGDPSVRWGPPSFAASSFVHPGAAVVATAR